MQGVNVVARPLDQNGNPLYQYTVTAVTGANFSGDHGNPATGFNEANGNALSMWGSSDSTLQGFFDLSGIPLPPGVTTANYQVTFEAIDHLYILENAVGPYARGQVAPSGTLESISVPKMSAGSTHTLTVTAGDSSVAGFSDALGAETEPRPMPVGGLWCGRLSQVGQTDWLAFPARGNRIFTVVTQALDETGAPSNSKALPSIGVWDAFDTVGATAVAAAPGLNGDAPGETWLRVATKGDDIVRIGIADLRGDGRPDYTYNGWALYADSVSPTHLPVALAVPITIQGMGFRIADTVLVGGRPAQVTSISPNQINAIAPHAAQSASGSPVTGSVDVEVDDRPISYAAAVIPSGVSYDSGTGDALTLVTAPSNTVHQLECRFPSPSPHSIPFSCRLQASRFSTPLPQAQLRSPAACPSAPLLPAATARASINLTAVDGTWSIVTASLTNGSSLQAQFAGGTPLVIAALTPQLHRWPPRRYLHLDGSGTRVLLSNGVPLGKPVGRLEDFPPPASPHRAPPPRSPHPRGSRKKRSSSAPSLKANR